MSLRMRHWQILQKQLQNLLTFIFIHQFFIQQLVLSLMSVKLNKLKVFLVLNYIFKCCRLLFFFFFTGEWKLSHSSLVLPGLSIFSFCAVVEKQVGMYQKAMHTNVMT